MDRICSRYTRVHSQQKQSLSFYGKCFLRFFSLSTLFASLFYKFMNLHYINSFTGGVVTEPPFALIKVILGLWLKAGLPFQLLVFRVYSIQYWFKRAQLFLQELPKSSP
jgi:hypothetical protein